MNILNSCGPNIHLTRNQWGLNQSIEESHKESQTNYY